VIGNLLSFDGVDGSGGTSRSADGASPTDGPLVSDPGDSLLHKSKLWRCGKRRLLNCRQAIYYTAVDGG
jgi:hypothetical protein